MSKTIQGEGKNNSGSSSCWIALLLLPGGKKQSEPFGTVCTWRLMSATALDPDHDHHDHDHHDHENNHDHDDDC